MRGAIGISNTGATDNIQAAEYGQRRLGWLFDMIQDLASQNKEETPTASPTASPVVRSGQQPLAGKVNKKKNGKKKNGRNEVV
eukprot:CCRYP_007216-RA/>CCRYP_007216-RA protein AED:0.37 eAED:0.37 QI:0/-1/0/1/-1/1/1/0/82